MGTNVYERDWDALLILDACRVDALEAVADEFDFIDDVDSIWSRGSTSQEWMAQTFTREWRDAIADTIYLVGNGFAKQTFEEGGRPILDFNPLSFPAFDVVDAADFKLLKGVWGTGHDDRLGNVPPRYITDRAIELGRDETSERLIVHYNQPHAPYLANAVATDSAPSSFESDPFPPLRRGELSREKAWAMYLDNLRLVLNDVELLLENLDAERVVITADHGEAFGEWGQYGHPNASPLPAVRKVPWVETTASDARTHTPAEEDNETSTDIEDHLADLGYL
ncbi:alkaline phosphatase family protein [Halococcus agarilyticus]|uniref:hypothetical protein n=1 Tax=Halococcus agarilyticus TaxID=1232219 RepID=UPI000ABDD114|nr:hypothetical protein [Halococcus agarilyticus]